MAVLVGLALGFVGGYQRSVAARFWMVVAVPLAVAALEIAVNIDRFGAMAMAVWAVILIALTIGATAGALAVGRRVRTRRAT